MIISHKHRFIFIKTRKTAGTSIEVFLSQACGDNDVVTPIIPHVPPHEARNHEGFFNHMAATDIQAKIGAEVWANYFKFCVERNPWDKTVSEYFMRRGRGEPSLAFDEFLRGDKLPSSVAQYYREDEGLLVDRVAKFEQLDHDLGEIFSTLGIPFAGNLGVNAKGDYRTDRRHYREFYTPEQAAIVAQRFRVEIALHGYSY